jgi:hypothetical protein
MKTRGIIDALGGPGSHGERWVDREDPPSRAERVVNKTVAGVKYGFGGTLAAAPVVGHFGLRKVEKKVGTAEQEVAAVEASARKMKNAARRAKALRKVVTKLESIQSPVLFGMIQNMMDRADRVVRAQKDENWKNKDRNQLYRQRSRSDYAIAAGFGAGLIGRKALRIDKRASDLVGSGTGIPSLDAIFPPRGGRIREVNERAHAADLAFAHSKNDAMNEAEKLQGLSAPQKAAAADRIERGAIRKMRRVPGKVVQSAGRLLLK